MFFIFNWTKLYFRKEAVESKKPRYIVKSNILLRNERKEKFKNFHNITKKVNVQNVATFYK